MTARLAGFRQGLQKRGWSEGRNVSIDICFAPDGSADQAQVLAKELIALQPDVILAHGTPTVAALQREPQSCSLVSSTRSGQDLLRTRNDTARRQYRLTGVKQI